MARIGRDFKRSCADARFNVTGDGNVTAAVDWSNNGYAVTERAGSSGSNLVSADDSQDVKLTHAASQNPIGVIENVDLPLPSTGEALGSIIDDGRVWVRVSAAIQPDDIGKGLVTTTTKGVLNFNATGAGRVLNGYTDGTTHYALWDIRG